MTFTVLFAVAFAAPNSYGGGWKGKDTSSHYGGSESHENQEHQHGSHSGSHSLPGSKAVVSGHGGKHWEHNSGYGSNTQQPSKPVRKLKFIIISKSQTNLLFQVVKPYGVNSGV